MTWWYAPAMVLAAYLMGSVAFGILVSPLFRLADPRSYGSHNPGATNVLRSGNKVAAVLTLLGDAFKGWLAVYVAQHFASAGGWAEATIAASALAVFVGHLWPIFFRFQGGKGVATALGVLLGINVWLAVAVLVAVGTGVSVAVAVAVAVGVSVAVAVLVAVGTSVSVAVAVAVAVGTGVSVAVAVLVAVGTGVSVAVGVAVAVAVEVAVAVGGLVGVVVAVAVAVAVGRAVGVAVVVAVGVAGVIVGPTTAPLNPKGKLMPLMTPKVVRFPLTVLIL